jgi:hypothetical protein
MQKVEKVVDLGDEKVKFIYPNVRQNSEADLEYSKAYTKALLAGLIPRAAMERRLKESGAWVEADDDEINQLGLDINDLIIKLNVEKDTAKRQELKIQFLEARNKLYALSSRRQSLFTNTPEIKGEEAKIAELLWQCSFKEDGSKIWNSKEEFLNSNDIKYTEKIIGAFVGFTTNLDENLALIEDLLSDKDIAPQEDVEEVQKEVVEQKEEVVANEEKQQ